MPHFVLLPPAGEIKLFSHAHLFLILHLQIFPHDMIGLSVFAQNKAVGADPVKAVLFVKTQSALILFPNAEPDILLLLLRAHFVPKRRAGYTSFAFALPSISHVRAKIFPLFLKGFSPRRCSRKYSAKTLSFAEDIGSVADGLVEVGQSMQGSGNV